VEGNNEQVFLPKLQNKTEKLAQICDDSFEKNVKNLFPLT